MKKLFWGFIFIFFNFSFNLGSVVINLIPDFVGYIFIVKGLSELSFESSWFDRARPFAIGMIIYSGILYILDLFGAGSNLANSGFSVSILTSITSLLSSIVYFIILYFIVLGIGDMEAYYKTDLKSKTLMILVTIEIIVLAINNICTLLAIYIGKTVLLITLTIVTFILNVILLVFFHKSRKIYEKLPKHVDPANNDHI